jgi:hypothetical protein
MKVYACANPTVWGRNPDGSYNFDHDIGAQLKRDEREFEKLVKASKKAKDEGKLAGIVIGIGWADGNAYYKVVQEKPLALEHIPVGDAWDVPDYQLRGLTAKDIRRMAVTGEW